MKKYLSIGIFVALVFFVGIFVSKNNQNVGVTPNSNIRVTSTASTTVFTVGHQLSVNILSQKQRRMYASICNNANGQRGYLVFSGTAVTGTTTASILLPTSTCYEINQDNPYIGAVQYIQETGTSTSLLVTELIY